MMPNQYISILVCFFLIFLSACGDDECEVFEWIGEYHQISEICDTSVAAFDTIFIITDGFGENTLRLNNGFFEVTGCDAEIPSLFTTLELDNDQLTAKGFGCTAVFQRQ